MCRCHDVVVVLGPFSSTSSGRHNVSSPLKIVKKAHGLKMGLNKHAFIKDADILLTKVDRISTHCIILQLPLRWTGMNTLWRVPPATKILFFDYIELHRKDAGLAYLSPGILSIM
jgi:hypothetical protein